MQSSKRASIDDNGLSIVLRILAGTDGTVTHILEAYAAEAVDLVKVSQSWVSAPADRASLGIADGERALRRVILLRGAQSHATFAYADSVVMLDRLPPSVADGLLNSEVPIGKLLRRCRAETFREVVAVWEERDEHIALHLGIDASDCFLSRAYQIEFGGRIVAEITEKFPMSVFPDNRTASVPRARELDGTGRAAGSMTRATA